MRWIDDNINLVQLQDVVRWVNHDNNDEVVIFEASLNAGKVHLPVRFDALVVVLIEEAEGWLEVNLQRYDLEPGCMLVHTPKDYLSGFSSDLSGKATVMMCGNHIVQHLFPKMRGLLPLIVNYVEQPVIGLTAEQHEIVRDMMSVLNRILQAPDTLFRGEKINTMIQTIILEVLELRYIDSSRRQAQTTRKEEIFSRFLKLVNENFQTCRTVQYYAEELCVTPKHLTTTVKDVSRRTAREWIDDFVIMEAKQLLRDSTLTIQEISDRLHFANQSFFGKYFKNLTGGSPSSYRRGL